MLDYVNDLRTGDDAWYWDSDDETTITCSDLSELEYDYELEKVAMQRAAELAVYFSHTRPNGETTWTAFTDYSYSYTSVGENIAAGYSSASSAFTGWAEADEDYSGQGHRRNMLSSSFTRIGIACVKYNGRYYWAMELAKSSVSNSETTATDGAKTVSIEIADSSITSISTTASVSSYSLFVGDTADLPVITASFATSEIWPTTSTATATADATWSSSNTDYVTVSDSEITAVASGQAEITATAYGDTFEIPVSVYSEPTFDWDSEYLTCTAIFTCGSDSEEVDCTVTNTESVDPTCTEDGYIVYEAECTFGGSTFSDSVTETVEATGHTMEMTEAVDATCEEAGNSGYYTCTECGKYYSDEAGTDEIDEDSWIIEATGHTLVSFAKKAAATTP